METHLWNNESKFKNETFEQFISKKMSLNHRKIFDRSSPTFEFNCCADRFQFEDFFSEIISDLTYNNLLSDTLSVFFRYEDDFR